MSKSRFTYGLEQANENTYKNWLLEQRGQWPVRGLPDLQEDERRALHFGISFGWNAGMVIGMASIVLVDLVVYVCFSVGQHYGLL